MKVIETVKNLFDRITTGKKNKELKFVPVKELKFVPLTEKGYIAELRRQGVYGNGECAANEF